MGCHDGILDRRPMIPKPPFLVRIVRARPRLFIAGAVGVVAGASAAVATDWLRATRLLAGWDIGIALYLVLAFHMMARSDVHHIRRRAALQDEGQLAILGLTVAAALASLGAIFAELGRSPAGESRPTSHLVLATMTIVLSWAFIHMIFALHYAHEFYDEGAGGGMAFPGRGEQPPGGRVAGRAGAVHWLAHRADRRAVRRGNGTWPVDLSRPGQTP